MHAISIVRLAPPVLLVGLLAWFPAPVSAQSPPVEAEPTLKVADFKGLPPTTGQGYRIAPAVRVSGFQGQFVVETDLGEIVADGSAQLRERIAEAGPAAELEKMSSSEVFVDALAKSTGRSAQAIGKAVTNPVDTFKGVPAGVGRFFGSVKTKVSDGGSGDPTGIGKVRRELAHEVGVDPYTSNPLIARRLDDLSKAAYAGGVSLDVAFTVATGGAAAAISFTKTVSNLAWQLPPEDIRTRNRNDLEAMNVSGSTRDAFLGNGSYTPTLALAYVEALKALGVKEGAGDFTQLAAGAASETEARFYIDQLRMAAVYGKSERIGKLAAAGQVGVMHAGNKLFVPMPVDYLAWTDGVKSAIQGDRFGSGARVAWFSGAVSPNARKGLEAAGWTVREHAPRG
jgi:hypothetical protein